ncbi:PQQ-binding-like beta-propeller repeat protein [Aquimarina longa]|uniref:outer membrane protein assembly factor BamB family protein n=1 Tax=Aquimarina longa TaxID=1080221 RepID=UPI0007815511|nr:PQQ-binding-like beta-propeller repeat protein [Aquimarina longa]
MKKIILIILITFYHNYSQGQDVIESTEPNESNSNNTILTKKDWLQNKLNKKVTYDKTAKDLIIINRYDGLLECYDLSLNKQWAFKPSDTLRLNNGGNHFFYKNGAIFTAYMTGYVYALNVRNGSVFWADKVGIDGEKNHFTSQSLAIAKDKLFLTSRTNRNLYAINSLNGKLEWNYELVSPHSYRPYLALNDKVFINNDPLVNSFEIETGKPLIQKNFESNIGKAVTDGELIIIPLTRGDKIVSFLPDTFEQKWEFIFKDEYYNVGEKIFIDDDKVYFATETNGDSSGVYCLNAKDGSLIWEKTIEGDIKKLEKSNGTIYGYTNEKMIFSITIKNAELDKIKTKYQPASNIEIYNESLYYYAKEGLIKYDFEKKKEEIVVPYRGKEKRRFNSQILFIK